LLTLQLVVVELLVVEESIWWHVRLLIVTLGLSIRLISYLHGFGVPHLFVSQLVEGLFVFRRTDDGLGNEYDGCRDYLRHSKDAYDKVIQEEDLDCLYLFFVALRVDHVITLPDNYNAHVYTDGVDEKSLNKEEDERRCYHVSVLLDVQEQDSE
jgi:hypothetical protein